MDGDFVIAHLVTIRIPSSGGVVTLGHFAQTKEKDCVCATCVFPLRCLNSRDFFSLSRLFDEVVFLEPL